MLIYEKACHGLYYDDQKPSKNYFSLAIHTLELVVNYDSGKLLYAIGFFPLIRATKRKVCLPECEKFEFSFDEKIRRKATPTVAYNFDDFFPKCKQLFTEKNLYYDDEQGIMKYGKDTTAFHHIKISDNLFIATNSDNEIQCLYIKPDKFI